MWDSSVFAVEAEADDEHLDAFGSACAWFVAACVVEHASGALEEVGVVAAFEDLDHHVAATMQPLRHLIEEVIAEPHALEVIAHRIACGFRRHVGKHRVKALAADVVERDFAKIRVHAMYIFREPWVNRRDVHSEHNPLMAHAICSDLRPRAWRSTRIKHTHAATQHALALLNTNELVRRTRAVALFFGEFEPMVLNFLHRRAS